VIRDKKIKRPGTLPSSITFLGGNCLAQRGGGREKTGYFPDVRNSSEGGKRIEV